MNGGKWLIENCPSERNLAKESQIKGFLSLSLFFQKEKKKKDTCSETQKISNALAFPKRNKLSRSK